MQKSNTVAFFTIAGMGGVGKTELATQYARKHEADYPGGISWLNARESNLAAAIVLCYQQHTGKEVPKESGEKLLNPQEQAQWCWQHWQPLEGLVLVVLDDVTDLGSLFQVLPKENRFRVLMTTRSRNLNPNFIKEIPLDVLSETEALELLKAFVGKKRLQLEQQTAEELCAWLGYLPLGLELVGVYLGEDPDLSLAEMLARLKALRLEDKALERQQPTLSAAQLGVKAAFELSWRELNLMTQGVSQLLSLFAQAVIPWKLVESATELLNWAKSDINEAKKQLYKFYLIQRIEEREGCYKIHPLIREFFATKLNERADIKALQQSLYRVMAAVAEKITESPTQHERKELSCAEPHIIEVATTLQNFLSDEDLNEDLKEDLTKPYVGLARLYISRGIYKEAERWYEKCKSVVQNYLGSQHEEFAAYLNNLGRLYIYQGRYDEALPLLEQALDLSKQLYGETHLHVAKVLSNLASLYCSQRHFDKAQPLLTTALEIVERGLEKEDSDLAVFLNNLAGLYSGIGIYQQAESILLKTLKIAKKIFGDEHPTTANYMNSLAYVYQKQGHFIKSEFFFREVLEVRKKLFGEEDLDVAESLNNLGIICAEQMRYGEAIPLLEQAIEIYRKLLGDRDPRVEECRNSLKNIQYDLIKKMWDDLEFR